MSTKAEDHADAVASLKDQLDQLRRAFTSTWMVAERLAKGNAVSLAEVREDAASFHAALETAGLDLDTIASGFPTT